MRCVRRRHRRVRHGGNRCGPRSGRLHTASELRAAITQEIDRGAASLVVDLSEATFVDSMTLGVLLGAVKRLRPAGGRVSVVCTDPHIRRIFEITLLDRVFTLYPDLGAALDGAATG